MWFKFKKAVLIIHGFAGGTWENEYLVNHLKMNSNYEVFDFTLPGHQLDVIKGVKYEEWLSASEEMLKQILKGYPTVYLVGHSMGGVIASTLASKYKRVKKLVLLAPGFEYVNMEQIKKDFKNYFTNKTEYTESMDGIVVSDKFMKMIRVPLSTIFEFTKLVKACKDDIKNVECKTLIMHGVLDEVVPPSGSEYAYNNIGSKDKYFTKIDGIRHRILASKKKEEVSKYITSFLIGGLEWELMKKSEM